MSLLHFQYPTEHGSDFDKLPPKWLSESDIATIPELVLVTFLKSNVRNIHEENSQYLEESNKPNQQSRHLKAWTCATVTS